MKLKVAFLIKNYFKSQTWMKEASSELVEKIILRLKVFFSSCNLQQHKL